MQTIVRKPILAGVTPTIEFDLVDAAGAALVPDLIVMSVYDVTFTPVGSSVLTTFPPFGSTPLAEAIVNGRDDVDVSGYVDTAGHFEYTLEAADTEVDVPTGATPLYYYRRILFSWTYDGSPAKVGAHEIILTIVPNRRTLAT